MLVLRQHLSTVMTVPHQKRQAPKSARPRATRWRDDRNSRRRSKRANAKVQLPELVKPDGPGYMPLYCAAQWIVTRGGTLEINPLDEALWREAFKDLLDRIASEDVKVVGLRKGATETVSGMHFASCSVNYPFSFSGPQDDLIFSKELCLFSRPYLDDEHWRGGFNDCLEDRRGVRWGRLMVLKADVARCWPFAIAQDHRTGAPPSHIPAARPMQPGERLPRTQSARERARRVIAELFPNGVPDQATKSNPELIRAVENQIKKLGQQNVSHDTILRAAGRRK